MMDEQILPAIVRRDKAETLLLIEPLHNTSCHVVFSLDPPDPHSSSLYGLSGAYSEGREYTP
jgi:hypothetical protein